MDVDCIFCKIIRKEVPAEIVYEDEEIIAFKDINPSAETHILIIPKKHIESLSLISASDEAIMLRMLKTAKELAYKLPLAARGYKLILNVDKGGGQIVRHIHLHFLAGEHIKLP
ncbi:MAG TPA: histidine triad nucleotide-binding protein [Candidatus Pacearchaeota archaeon]|nr:histidine triad nucleotide-binding protein [Candidatus Pacearchaeota archaeon]